MKKSLFGLLVIIASLGLSACNIPAGDSSKANEDDSNNSAQISDGGDQSGDQSNPVGGDSSVEEN